MAYGNDFGELDADPKCADTEEPGLNSWKGADLPYIKAKRDIPSLFPQELETFLKNVWKIGVVNTAAPQRNFLAQQRGRVVPDILPEKYTPIPNPTAAPPGLNPRSGAAPCRRCP